ncbi:hypothetical protein DO021_15480 [Desulfobacter hydrogenophilus]|uniref:Uncharacterized protein n=1 Tax=Desulfobacter hydrogenophilus TaxID=2291 RepID=A0A328F9P2_9BACT|nr:hypothetical protein [Desulfobacter hydrogenophilus]NDY73083.1 hypothetical protein [Desulfobacter hydrogenophilus]QBH13567.1 hypothetical protein EYB58_11905 [Desulfobacter hydrogenophilus]RAM01089.1 hypothetical protein DO021_15480 [Desulfobacter hydrogenophilus]
MKIGDVMKLQQTLMPKIDELCTRPVASSQKQVDFWQNNHGAYLKEKAKRVLTLPDSLQNEVDQMFASSKEFYLNMVAVWYKSSHKSLSKTILMEQQRSGIISKEQMRKSFDKIKSIDVQSIGKDQKIQFFFEFFESLIEQIKNQKEWSKLYQISNLGLLSDRLVWNISALDLCAWQLPLADTRNINDYQQLAKIMTIFFFFEKIYKNWFKLDSINDVNPFDVVPGLNKILAYYM